MSNKEYIKVIIEMVRKIQDNRSLRLIYYFVKGKL